MIAGGGEGDRLGAVSVLEPGAVSVLNEGLAFGTAPEVEAVGDDGVVLGLDDWADEVDEEVKSCSGRGAGLQWFDRS